jgi:hypothetical protein
VWSKKRGEDQTVESYWQGLDIFVEKVIICDHVGHCSAVQWLQEKKPVTVNMEMWYNGSNEGPRHVCG